MVLYVKRYNIPPEKAEAYGAWVKSATARILAVPGIVELRGYRPVSGPYQVVSTYEFADLATWAAWRSHPDVEKAFTESRALTPDQTLELWGPSPIAPDPIRPGG